jgi:hypothetical protein
LYTASGVLAPTKAGGTVRVSRPFRGSEIYPLAVILRAFLRLLVDLGVVRISVPHLRELMTESELSGD